MTDFGLGNDFTNEDKVFKALVHHGMLTGKKQKRFEDSITKKASAILNIPQVAVCQSNKKSNTNKKLTNDEKINIINIMNDFGKQWKWVYDGINEGMFEMPNPDHDEYTMELLEMDIDLFDEHMKNLLDFDDWLFVILSNSGGSTWAKTIFSRLGKTFKE
jgi:aspartyl aminopeptidase